MLKASFRVLRENRRLAVLPLLSIAAEAVVIASFFVPYAVAEHGSSAATARLTTTTYALLVTCAVVATAVSLFFTSALFLATADAMNGDEVSLKAALRGAARRLPSICAWAVASCTVSLFLRLVDWRVPIVPLMINIAWSSVTYLALPVMVFEGAGMPHGVRRAVTLFKSTWRELAVGTVRLNVLSGLLMIPAVIVFVIGIGTVDGPLIVLSIAVCLLWFGLCALVVSSLTSVYRVALYRFAATGVTPESFSAMDLGEAFR